jgi:hypothetical protein
LRWSKGPPVDDGPDRSGCEQVPDLDGVEVEVKPVVALRSDRTGSLLA